MRKLFILMLTTLLALPTLAGAATVADLEKKIKALEAEVEELVERADDVELHTATDKLAFSGDLRVRANTLRYNDVKWFVPGMPPTPYTYNLTNSVLYTTRMRLDMKAKVWDNVDFAGRLSMYKNWGDSTGVKLMDSFTGVTMDGTNGGNTTGDWLRVERAYFNWKEIGDSNFWLSIGRRPSTYGPPSQFRENELRGGTPSGHLVHFNFDGVTIGYRLEEATGLEGMKARFCYGQGYESELGNGELMGMGSLKDTHLGGFNVDVIDDGTTLVQATLFRAQDITDGFKGLFADPMGGGVVTRMQATTNVGNMWIGGLGFTREEENGLKYFGSFGWNQSDPNGRISNFPVMFGAPMPYGGLLSEDGQGSENGYSVYVGVQIPAPMGKFGLEYNWGSQYWFNFVQAADDAVAPKLAARGQVGEAYYIFDVNPSMFIKLAGLYYDYEYSGSGNPIGAPTKIKEMTGMEFHGMMPVVDKAVDVNASLTVKF